MPVAYRIRVKGHLDPGWSSWFNGLKIIHGPDDETILTGQVYDQAELIGILVKINDLNLTLLSVNPADGTDPKGLGDP